MPFLFEKSESRDYKYGKVKQADKCNIIVLLHGLDSSNSNMVKIMNYISIVSDKFDFVLPNCRFIKANFFN